MQPACNLHYVIHKRGFTVCLYESTPPPQVGHLRPVKPLVSSIKVAGYRFRLSVCIYEKSMHEVRRMTPKMCEIFTNRLRNVSASIVVRTKRCLVKYTILQRIVLFAWSVDNSPYTKISKISINIYFCIRAWKPSEGKNKQFGVQEFSADIEFHEMILKGGKLGVL